MSNRLDGEQNRGSVAQSWVGGLEKITESMLGDGCMAREASVQPLEWAFYVHQRQK